MPLFTLRAALIITLAVLIGVGAGVLTYLAGQSQPASVLAGCTAFGASVVVLNNIISSA